MDKEIIKEYSNGEVTVVWKPAKCIHSEICVKTLPQVYKPGERPWIQAENAATCELIDQINKCPSGALTYKGHMEESTQENVPTAQVLKDGPLMVNCTIKVINADGNEVVRENKTAFCRCGASSNKPYCDGSHKGIGFEG
jgi:uncharacterized Fe-S cluster protein YjdI